MMNTSNNTSQRPASRDCCLYQSRLSSEWHNQQQESAILAPLAYFDLFNYPLTELEIWKWTYCRNFQFLSLRDISRRETISEIQKILENSENLRKAIGCKDGFYFLKGREGLVARRRDSYREAEQRWEKLRRVANILQYVPFVKMVAGCNTLAINDFKPGSDIDAFIITRQGRIWQARFWVTMLVIFLGEWRHKGRVAEKICLSFYLADDALNLESIAKKPYDIYLAYWVAMVAPLYETQNSKFKTQNHNLKLKTYKTENIYEEFLKANQWVRNFLPNFIEYEPVKFERKVGKSQILTTVKIVLEKILSGKIGDKLENFFRKVQRRKMEKNYASAYHRHNSDVIISDQMLKFHEIDRRDEFRRRFELKLAEILKGLDNAFSSR